MGQTGHQGLDRVLGILDLFTEGRPEWSPGEISAATGLASATAYRIIASLEAAGLLRRVGNHHYRLGAAAISLGNRAAATFDLRSAIHPELRALSTAVGETVLLSAFDSRTFGCLVLDRIEASTPLRLILETGSSAPLHAGASSKALLAHLPPETIAEVLARPLPRLAPGTITDPDRLRAELDQVRDRGWATSFEETDAGAWGIGVPVLGDDGIALAVIGAAGPLVRHTDELERRMIDLATTTAATAATRMGVRRTPPHRPANQTDERTS